MFIGDVFDAKVVGTTTTIWFMLYEISTVLVGGYKPPIINLNKDGNQPKFTDLAASRFKGHFLDVCHSNANLRTPVQVPKAKS